MSKQAELRVARVHIAIRFSEQAMISSNWGPTLRGGFGTALRELSCSLARDSCSGCALARSCAYGYLFETPIEHSDTVMRRYTHAPHAFVMEPPADEPSRVGPEMPVNLSIVLIGKALKYLPSVLLAMEELGRRGLGRDRVPFEVNRLSREDGTALQRLESPPDKGAGPLVLDMLGNARRHGLRGQRDEAALRCYRAVELCAQRRLKARFGIDNDAVREEQAPEPLRSRLLERNGPPGEEGWKLGLRDTAELLKLLGDRIGESIVESLPHPRLQTPAQLRAAPQQNLALISRQEVA